MENSEAYKRFIKQLKSIGAAKKDGYDPRTIDLLYEWERGEVEDIIWNYFNNKNDYLLCTLMPKLEKYDGVKHFKKVQFLIKFPVPEVLILVAFYMNVQKMENTLTL